MNKEEFVKGWLSHIRRPNYPQKSIDLMKKELDEMILFESKKLEKSRQADVSGSLPLTKDNLAKQISEMSDDEFEQRVEEISKLMRRQ